MFIATVYFGYEIEIISSLLKYNLHKDREWWPLSAIPWLKKKE